MSAVKNILQGEGRGEPQQIVKLPGGGHTRADFVTSRSIVESKFGGSRPLRGRQAQAQRELPNYRVDRWTPDDVGKVTGTASSTTATTICRDTQPGCHP